MAKKAKNGTAVAKKPVVKKATVKKTAVSKVPSLADFQELAHAGTKEALEQLERYLQTGTDPELLAYAELAFEECQFFLYQPGNAKEEEDLILRSLIERRERDIIDLTIEADEIRLRVENLTVEKKVHDKVLSGHAGKKKAWAPFWMGEFLEMSKEELREITDEIEYDEAWIAEAWKMVKTEKYRTMPASFLRYFDLDDETSDDDYDEFDCDDDCDCDGSCGDECAPF